MKIKLLLLAALALATPALRAQLILQSFTAFESPTTLFYSEWAASGDPFSGDPSPAAGFSQGAGFYRLDGVTNADTAYLDHAFTAPLDLTGYDLLTVSLRRLTANTASSFKVRLVDTAFNTAEVTFLTADFGPAGFTTLGAALTPAVGFNLAAVASFQLTGDDAFASATFALDFDQLSAARSIVVPPLGAVPEPSTYGLAAAALLLAAALFARRRATPQATAH